MTQFRQADAVRISHHLRQLLVGRDLTQETRQAIRDAVEAVSDLAVAQMVIHDLREEAGRRLFGLGYNSEVLYVSDLLSEVVEVGIAHVERDVGTCPFIKEIPFREYAKDGRLWARAPTLYRIRYVLGIGPQLMTHKEYVSRYVLTDADAVGVSGGSA